MRLELAFWWRAGHLPVFWWRDDDARRPSSALDRLIVLAERSSTPLALAVIPDGDLGALAERLRACPFVRVIQHGCDHRDRNRGGAASAEFPDDASPGEVAQTVTAAWTRLAASLPAEPVFAPPWNRLTKSLAAALPLTPIRAVSTYGADAAPIAGLARINAHLDVMKWRPARFRGDAALWLRLWRQLRARRVGRRWSEPIGWLTHHANLDEAGWTFIAELFRRLGPMTGRGRWASIAQLTTAALEPRGAEPDLI